MARPMARATISNKAMLTVALLAVAIDIIGFMLVRLIATPQSTTSFDIGDLGLLVHAGSISGVLGSIVVLTGLVLGLNQEPRKKISGTVVCLIALTLLLVQVVTFVGTWLRTG